MGKDIYSFIIFFILIITLACVSFIYKSSTIFSYFAMLNILFLALLFFHLGREKKVKFFQFLIGDFTMEDTSGINKIIYGKRPEFYVYTTYRNATYAVIIPVFALINSINLYALIVTGLSIISVGGALSIMTFNYFRVKEKNEESNIFSSAKRFYLSTILGIFLLFSVLIFKAVPPVNTNEIIFLIYPFLISIFKIVINAIGILLIAFFLTTAIRYLIEGFILSLKETIILDS
jgi:hypothetical protein